MNPLQILLFGLIIGTALIMVIGEKDFGEDCDNGDSETKCRATDGFVVCIGGKCKFEQGEECDNDDQCAFSGNGHAGTCVNNNKCGGCIEPGGKGKKKLPCCSGSKASRKSLKYSCPKEGTGFPCTTGGHCMSGQCSSRGFCV